MADREAAVMWENAATTDRSEGFLLARIRVMSDTRCQAQCACSARSSPSFSVWPQGMGAHEGSPGGPLRGPSSDGRAGPGVRKLIAPVKSGACGGLLK